MTMYSRVVGKGRPIVLLHGLFGSGDNWLTLAGKMVGLEVHLPDLRNHGQSFWADDFRQGDLAEDLVRYLEARDLGPCVIAGHSLGAKVIMRVALEHPESVLAMVSLDMAPREYEPRYALLLKAIIRLDLARVTSRAEARDLLAPDFPDAATLAFLLKSLVSHEEQPGRLRWRLNLASLSDHFHEIWKAVVSAHQFRGPSLFLTGADSDYFGPRDVEAALELFPRAQFLAVPRAGHWLHADQPVLVLEELRSWLMGVMEWELPPWT